MRSTRYGRIVLCVALFALAMASQGRTATNFWFAPNGKGDGSTRDRPRAYNAKFMQWAVLNGGPGQVRDVQIHFLPGEYLVEPLNTSTTERSDWRIRIEGHGELAQDVVLKLQPNFAKGFSESGANWVDVIDLGRNAEYLERFEMENITIDGNWTGQDLANHSGYLRGYKNSPVYVNARTGRLRNVIVRNYGAHGVVPQRTNDLTAGVEVFPIHIGTDDEGQQPENGDARPWVVEDCEVADFHGPYNGYATVLMGVARLNVPGTPRWALEDPNSRLIWFRRNQVRGVPAGLGIIAQGAASHGTNVTGKITWSDNVVLNAAVFNTDTGGLRQLDFTNCLALDVSAVGYVGTHSTRVPFMSEYSISGNSFRFGWIFTPPDYRNYKVGNRPDGRLMLQEDPSLLVGRTQYPEISGLTIQGAARDIRLTDNWFTSRSREEFGSLSPLFPREPRFRIVHRLPPREPGVSNAPVFFRQEPVDMDLSDNRISSVPYDFTSMKPLSGGRFGKLTDGSSPLMEPREAMPTSGNFAPMGLPERLDMVFTNIFRRIAWKGVPPGISNDVPRQGVFEGPDRVLIGAVEVVCGRPSSKASQGTFRLPVRVAFQPTPFARIQGTTPLPRRRLFLEVLAGSKHPQRLTAESDSEGIATFSWPVAPGDNGVDYFRVWADGGGGRPGEWDEYQDAWSTAHHVHGRTVAVRVENDVANAEVGSPGRIRLLRTGPDDSPLTVKFALASGAHAATLGSDFRLVGPKKRGSGGGESELETSVEFAKGQSEVTIKVEPIVDKARSGRLVTLRIQPGEAYAPGEPPEGEVVVYSPRK